MMLNSISEFDEEKLLGLETALRDAPFNVLVQLFHKILVAQNILPTTESTNGSMFGNDHNSRSNKTVSGNSWQPYGMEIAHALLSACIYPESSVKLVRKSQIDNKDSSSSRPSRQRRRSYNEGPSGPEVDFNGELCSETMEEKTSTTSPNPIIPRATAPATKPANRVRRTESGLGLYIPVARQRSNSNTSSVCTPSAIPGVAGNAALESSPKLEDAQSINAGSVAAGNNEAETTVSDISPADSAMDHSESADQQGETEGGEKPQPHQAVSTNPAAAAAPKSSTSSSRTWKRSTTMMKMTGVTNTAQALEECLDMDEEGDQSLYQTVASIKKEYEVLDDDEEEAGSGEGGGGKKKGRVSRLLVGAIGAMGTGLGTDTWGFGRNSKPEEDGPQVNAANSKRRRASDMETKRNKRSSINAIDLASDTLRNSMANSAGAQSPQESKDEQQTFAEMIETIVYGVRRKSQIENERKENPPTWWKLHPNREKRQAWNIVMTFMLFYTMAALPLRICFTQLEFEYPTPGFFFETIVNSFFGLDMLVNCLTGVYLRQDVNERGKTRKTTITDMLPDISSNTSVASTRFVDMISRFRTGVTLSYKLKHILRNYLSGWFIIDFMSVFPWELFLQLALNDQISDFANAPRLLKLLRLVRLVKLLRLYRLQTVIAQMQKIFPAAMLEMMKLSIAVGVLAHYVACGFYYVAVLTDEDGSGSWLEKYHDHPSAVTVESAGSLYLSSMYWGFTTVTSVGYGDIVPVTHAEKLYALFVMYCGVVMMSGITGKLTAVLSQFGAQEIINRLQMESVETYCNYRDLPHHLRKSVTEYFEMRISAKSACDEDHILKEMSPALKAQVVCHSFQNIIKAVPFFAGCSTLFLSAVLCCMELVMYAPADIVVQKGQRELAMFVLAKGRAAVIDSFGRVIKELGNGQFFGEIGLFFGVRRTATVCSITFSDIFRLGQEEFAKVQETYPDMKERIYRQAEDMFSKSVRCYVCDELGHISLQCKKSYKNATTTGEEVLKQLEEDVREEEIDRSGNSIFDRTKSTIARIGTRVGVIQASESSKSLKAPTPKVSWHS